MVVKQAKDQIKFEIAGIALFSLAVLGLLSLLNPSAGVISWAVERLLRGVAGEGRFLFPVLLALWSWRLARGHGRGRARAGRRFGGPALLFLVALALLHLAFIPAPYTLNAGWAGEGGGLLGAGCVFLLQGSFGPVGTYVVLATLTLVGVLLSANAPLGALCRQLAAGTAGFYAAWRQRLEGFLFTETEEEMPEPVSPPPAMPVIIDRGGAGCAEPDPAAADAPPVAPVSVPAAHLREGKPKNGLRIVFPTGRQREPDRFTVVPPLPESAWHLPPLTILARPSRPKSARVTKDITENVRVLEETLESFGVRAKVTQVSRGPTITRYEIQPPPGIKVSRIVGLADDIALAMAAPDVRIEAPIPGKAAVGIEVPNREIAMVHLRELLETPEFMEAPSRLTVALGKDIAGNPVLADLARMPHLLIAGATGSGKSVCLNTLIASILFKASPDQVKFLIIDPKMVELATYNGIPHLTAPVVTDPKQAATSLRWAVREMERRYALFAAAGVRDITRYNRSVASGGGVSGQPVSAAGTHWHAPAAPAADEGVELPLMVIIIDELADLMMVAPADVEDAVCRLAQMARAAGMHLVVATQRPSVDVITGLIKANIPSRISFAVSSQIDSRTILDMAGAEKLLGKGDMLFYPVGAPKPVRVQGAFLSDREVEELVAFLKQQGEPRYEQRFTGEGGREEGSPELEDELLPQAVQIFIESGHASISLLQRRLHVGYARAARLIDIMERKGIVGGYEGSKPRAVLMTLDQYEHAFRKR
ncbi:DNA translocase FtsK [Desulfotomaculum copahuensis]|uniref:Cell division protein FtsK n=1 Tax=Desulfotomaculum copahuensis TaxID=1838280 RepID=A0A1B7LJE2_9FIRM|nr:DNA translocase FtsK [Desulfotomaculum copahuensis]OAT86685.1 cell division protein FtsK [Desulfotomaculum copahuensis]